MNKANRANWVSIQNTNPEDNFNVLSRISRDTSLDQITGYGNTQGGTTILHTVTADKVLCLSFWAMSWYNPPGGLGTVTMFARDTGDVTTFEFFHGIFPVNWLGSESGLFLPPYEVPAGYDICISASVANLYVRGSIHGYERDV